MRADLLSAAETDFYLNLEGGARGRFVVFPKVRLADLVFSPTRDVKATNRIDRKHVDFLLVEANSLKPRLVIELDDSSHMRAKAAERDAVKDAALRSAGLPLLRLALKPYSSAELRALVDEFLATAGAGAPPPPTLVATEPAGAPLCPNCDIPMVLRPAVPGRYDAFYGCSNYPRCWQVLHPGPPSSPI